MVTLQGSGHIAQMTRQLAKKLIEGYGLPRRSEHQAVHKCSAMKPALAAEGLIHHGRLFLSLEDCLVCLMEDRVVDVRPNFLEREGTPINGKICNPSLVGLGKRAFLAGIVQIGHA